MFAEPRLSCAIVIFAHNEQRAISRSIDSVMLSLGDIQAPVRVIANGCSDNTEAICQRLTARYRNLQLHSLPLADKANAWNTYIHSRAPSADVHVFIDGDVEIEVGAFSNLLQTFKNNSQLELVGGVPICGRDRQGWIQRMISQSRVSGALYALRGAVLKRLRNDRIRMPIGFIGEDFLISAIVKQEISLAAFCQPCSRIAIDEQAGFRFRPLSLLRVSDYKVYLRRLLRYRLRDYQLSYLLRYITGTGYSAMPETTEQLFCEWLPPPSYRWYGSHTLIDCLTVYHLRTLRQDRNRRVE